jgi:hypothetical protein
MQRFLKKTTEFFDIPVDLRGRLIIVLGAVLLVPSFFLPLWQFRFEGERYPDGLTLFVFAQSMEGGTESDLLEINALNHYLGMRGIEEEDFAQFRWLPFLIGVGFLIALRAAVLGKMSKIVDLFVFQVYLGFFSLWSFWNAMYSYGHDLNPFATIRVEPFTPPLIGTISVAHVQISSTPLVGAYLLVLVPVVFLIAVCLTRRSWVKEHLPGPDYIQT